ALVCDMVFFFFSSRRRHTRSYGDWSSDVCSSDLDAEQPRVRGAGRHRVDQVPRGGEDEATRGQLGIDGIVVQVQLGHQAADAGRDRKSTRLNSSHRTISYAVFCLKKKKQKQTTRA